ncbi:MAG TPA: hypothetical protein VNH11_02005 [Pirellulales bacterium]|nr:hypothetical protein [Pirellulales bacterium]
MTGKSQIVSELGERSLILPNVVNAALAANDRAKYLVALLQAAKAHADRPDAGTVDLKTERLACGVTDVEFDSVVEQSHKEADHRYAIPGARQIYELLVDQIRQMLVPIEVDATTASTDDGRPGADYQHRLGACLASLCPPDDDSIDGDTIDRVALAPTGQEDSLHTLIMDLHKEINRRQRQISTESVAGAAVYGLTDDDRGLVAAFMAGVHQTEKLKFDHPGLGTTATHDRGALVLQNDIGLTEAHVLVVRIEPPKVTVTYSDIHIQRLASFQALLRPLAVAWNDTVSKRSAGLRDLYHLSVGTFVAGGHDALAGDLTLLGSRLVFLIDWNRARKRLRKLAPKEVCLDVLDWAAANSFGHRAFLKLGGEQLVFDALRLIAQGPLQWGGQLADMLGESRTAEFLKFMLRTTAEGLLAGRSDALIRDEIRAELRRNLDTIQEGLLTVAGEHATLIVELATASRDCLLLGIEAGDRDYLDRTARRAKLWEHRADELLNRCRAARGWRSESSQPLIDLVRTADDAADKLEEAVFLINLLPSDGATNGSLAALEELSWLLVQGAQEYLKALENARYVHRGSARERIEDFLQAVDRTQLAEHQADDAHRRAKSGILMFSGDFKQLHLFTEIADNLEAAADVLMRSALNLRDYVFGDAITR